MPEEKNDYLEQLARAPKAQFGLRIKRERGYVDKARSYKVVLNGEVVASITQNQELELQITPGTHRLYLSIDWCRSPEVSFVYTQTPVSFVCGSAANPFLGLLYVTVWRDRYIWLRQE